MKSERLKIQKVIADKYNELNNLSAKINRLNFCLQRMYCGCLQKDCVEHGSYVIEDIEFVKNTLLELPPEGTTWINRRSDEHFDSDGAYLENRS